MKEVINVDDKKDITLAHTHVPDKLYGYGLQVRQMLYELLNCNCDSVVSVEKFDDVAVECGNQITAIQTKSALSNRNPVSDKAVDLWKTLYNWIMALKAGELPLDFTTFTLVINTHKGGQIVEWLHQASNENQAKEVYLKIKELFIGEDGSYIVQSDSINAYVVAFIEEQNRKYVLQIIEKFKLVIMDEGHTQKVYDEFKAKTYIPEDIKLLVFDKILGWIDRITALQIEQGKVMQVTKEDFNKEMTLIQKQVNQNKSLVELAQNPSDTEIELEKEEFRTYLRQLQIIDLAYEDQLIAINDYLKAFANRTIWAKTGDVNEEILENFYDDLKKRWRTKRNIVELDKTDWDEVKRGQYLYNICQDEDVNNAIIVAPHSFKNGCYHHLADQLYIGWHPKYEQKLKEDE